MIRKSEFAAEIYPWLRPKIKSMALPRNTRSAEYFKRRLGAHSSLIAEVLCSYICFSSQQARQRNKFAFDNLLGDKLRHNFISIRFAEKLHPVFEEYQISELLSVRILRIFEQITAAFSTEWITIHSGRSFVGDMTKGLRNQLSLESSSGRPAKDVAQTLSVNVAAIALTHFENLLLTCRKKWKTVYMDAALHELKDLTETEILMTQVIEDRLANAAKEAFDESSAWMQINENQNPSSIELRDLLIAETYLIKKQPQFRNHFQVHLADTSEGRGIQSIDHDIVLPGKYLPILVAIVDNLIPNACRSSRLGVNTPIRISCRPINGKLMIDVSNRINLTKIDEIAANVEKAKELLALPVKDEYLRKAGGGTGFYRIRHAGENEFPNEFKVGISLDSREEFPVTVHCEMPFDRYSEGPQ